jgi:hypothetical protein
MAPSKLACESNNTGRAREARANVRSYYTLRHAEWPVRALDWNARGAHGKIRCFPEREANPGGMAEWLKAAVLKTAVGL